MAHTVTLLEDHLGQSKPTVVGQEYCVDFLEPNYALTPEAEIMLWSWRFDRGLATPQDWFDYNNPDASQEERTAFQQQQEAQQSAQQQQQVELTKQAGQFANSPMADPTKNPNAEQFMNAVPNDTE